MNEEQIAKAKEAKSAEELLALAKEYGMDDFTEKDAEELFERLHTSTELTDEELEDVAGGCGSGSTTVKVDGVSYRKILLPPDTTCMTGQYKGSCSKDQGWHCNTCDHFVKDTEYNRFGYCDILYKQ